MNGDLGAIRVSWDICIALAWVDIWVGFCPITALGGACPAGFIDTRQDQALAKNDNKKGQLSCPYRLTFFNL